MLTDILAWLGFGLSFSTFVWDRWGQIAADRKADLVILLERPNRSVDRYFVVVANKGRANATDIRVEVDGKPAEERANYQKPRIPFPETIAPNAVRIYEYIGNAPCHARSTWRNRRGCGSGSFETMFVS